MGTKRREEEAIGDYLAEVMLWQGMGGTFDCNREAETIIHFPFKLEVDGAKFFFRSLDEVHFFRQGYENGIRAERNRNNTAKMPLPKRMD